MKVIKKAFLLVSFAAFVLLGIFAPVLVEAQSCDPRHFNRACQPYFTGLSNVDPSYSHPANRYPPGHPSRNGNWNRTHPAGFIPPAGWGGPTMPWSNGGNTDLWGNVGYVNGNVMVNGGYRTFDPATGTSHGGSVYGDSNGNRGGNFGFHTRR